MFSDKEIHDLVGIPFVDHGRTTNGFDCWGLVMHIYQSKESTFQNTEFPQGSTVRLLLAMWWNASKRVGYRRSRTS